MAEKKVRKEKSAEELKRKAQELLKKAQELEQKKYLKLGRLTEKHHKDGFKDLEAFKKEVAQILD